MTWYPFPGCLTGRRSSAMDGVWQKRGPGGLGLNGAEHLPKPPATLLLPSDWPLYHHQVALLLCHPNWLGERPGDAGPSRCSGLTGAVEEFPVENRARFHPELWLKPERAGGWNSRAVVAAMWKEADYFCYKLEQGKQDKWLGLGQHRGRGKTEIGWYELQRIVGITQWLRSV